MRHIDRTMRVNYAEAEEDYNIALHQEPQDENLIKSIFNELQQIKFYLHCINCAINKAIDRQVKQSEFNLNFCFEK